MGGLAPEIAVVKDRLDPDKPLVTEKDCLDKLTQLKMRREKVKRAIVQAERQQTENLAFLKEKGIEKVADAKDDPAATMTLNNMKALKEMISKREEEVGLLDTAISRLDGMLGMFRRDNLEKAAGLSEDQMVELIAIQKELDDKLGLNENDLFLDAELDEMLSEAKEEDKERSDRELLENNN